MQVKRFVARDMTTALAKVKQAFGPDAVIMSVKSLRQGKGVFGFLTRPGVEVVAATDPVKSGKSSAGAGGLEKTSNDVESLPSGDEQPLEKVTLGSGSGKHPEVTEIDRKMAAFKKKSDGKSEKTVSAPYSPRRFAMDSYKSSVGLSEQEAGVQDVQCSLFEKLSLQKVKESVSQRLVGSAQAKNISSDSQFKLLSSAIDASGIPTGPVVGTHDSSPRIVVLTGPAGVGKTSMAAKLAIYHAHKLNQKVGLISLDNSRVASGEEIEAYGRIIGIPLKKVTSKEQLGISLEYLKDRDLILIDTPGVSPGGIGRLRLLNDLFSEMDTYENHLLLSAATKEDDLAAVIRRFELIPVHGLIFTKLDETNTHGSLLNLSLESGIPISYFSNGPGIPEDIKPATAHGIASLILQSHNEMTQGGGSESTTMSKSVMSRTTPDSQAGSFPQADSDMNHEPSLFFVANKNSDIFHVPDCKWTKMIKSKNTIVFQNIRDAESKRFHACRSCCPGATVGSQPPGAFIKTNKVGNFH
jgi:flagellar biosynthesis protein FlhF